MPSVKVNTSKTYKKSTSLSRRMGTRWRGGDDIGAVCLRKRNQISNRSDADFLY